MKRMEPFLVLNRTVSSKSAVVVSSAVELLSATKGDSFTLTATACRSVQAFDASPHINQQNHARCDACERWGCAWAHDFRIICEGLDSFRWTVLAVEGNFSQFCMHQHAHKHSLHFLL